MLSTYDSWLTTAPSPPHIHHDDAYPEGYVCRCGESLWEWDSDALAWSCEDCGEYLDQGAYCVLTPAEQHEEALLDAAGL